MPLLDLPTIVLMASLLSLAMAVVLFSAKLSFPSEIKGIGHWTLGSCLMVLAGLFFAGRGLLPDWASVIFGNLFFFWGLGSCTFGTQLLYGKEPHRAFVHPPWVLGMAGILWWQLVTPDFGMRVVISAPLYFAYYFFQFVVIVRNGERHFSTWFFGFLMGVQSLVVLVRCSAFLNDGNLPGNLFDGNLLTSVYIATTSFMSMMLAVGFMTVATRRLQITLEQRSNLDPLTGIFNRRGLGDRYRHEVERMTRDGGAMSLMCIDLDHFKSINDRFGHSVGDHVLKHVADTVGSALRASDCVARIGGEEFVVLLPKTTINQALRVAWRIQELMRVSSELPACTVSIGIASQTPPQHDLEPLLLQADKLLYQAKEKGRNRIETAAQD